MRSLRSAIGGYKTPFGQLRLFNPLALFLGGDEGIWYDRSDISTLFQDSVGATPVTAAGQSDALKLDKSQGLGLGSELVTNGDFATDTTWNKTGWTISGGVASNDGTGTDLWQPDANNAGKLLEVTFTISNYVSGYVEFAMFNPGQTRGTARTANATYTELVYISNTGPQLGLRAASFVGDVDNLSVKALLGNHSSQPTGGFQSKRQVSPQRSEYDGNDDFSPTLLKPTTSGTIAVRMRSDTASKVAFGSQPASDGRCYAALASDGSFAAGIGEQATSVIKGTDDMRANPFTGVITWDGTTVNLHQDGVQVYSGSQVGAVNTTVDMYEGALNANGTAGAFHDGWIAQSIVLDRVMTAAEITNLTKLWSTIE